MNDNAPNAARRQRRTLLAWLVVPALLVGLVYWLWGDTSGYSTASREQEIRMRVLLEEMLPSYPAMSGRRLVLEHARRRIGSGARLRVSDYFSPHYAGPRPDAVAYLRLEGYSDMELRRLTSYLGPVKRETPVKLGDRVPMLLDLHARPYPMVCYSTGECVQLRTDAEREAVRQQFGD